MTLTVKRGRGRPPKEFVPMEKTRALLSELWGHWRETLNHTPDKARRVLTAAITELHKDEVKALKKARAASKKAKTTTKRTAKKVAKKVSTKTAAAKRRIKKV